ncbi:hypothetical protein JDV02_004452 [Purpureocillium takamizusanense]|uniref:NADH:ubiquinone oxidoreductase intermediate-associated protein 30 domain-containing protein n=1 Tax=Purpureocillium takamizusanense TaxID=2060973 RepID=A0A9Q8V9Z4_9HYPO|nr:uncharacterized protein JDV02_004452 [Purpureocillium takamizusanense]UNI18168.1 hypothetical protein JDV02_004452 [Purpureocillium takamizusanense]
MIDDVLYLYGGDQPWDSSLWETSDDRVRGGASQSHLTVDNPERARFHGHLDTTALGGAGFASQHSIGELALDLRDYEGIIVAVAGPDEADGKRYALTLKDSLPPPRDDGREQSGVSWEAEFVAKKPGDVKLRWDDFKPTYRGRPKHDAEPLNLGDIKRVGLMMRSFFGKQEGDFSLHLHGIVAFKQLPASTATTVVADHEEEEEKPKKELQRGNTRKELRRNESDLEEFPTRPAVQKRPWWRKLLCGLA